MIVQYGQAPIYIMEERDEGIKEKQLRKTKSLWVESRRAYFVFLHESNIPSEEATHKHILTEQVHSSGPISPFNFSWSKLVLFF